MVPVLISHSFSFEHDLLSVFLVLAFGCEPWVLLVTLEGVSHHSLEPRLHRRVQLFIIWKDQVIIIFIFFVVFNPGFLDHLPSGGFLLFLIFNPLRW
mmetsp:Transcript_1668/g.1604  ORF Transcript_1668/g.1604 Transcript_1668/m.1604 type:complete len:97 (-) Transcript_1668:5-295(-)